MRHAPDNNSMPSSAKVQCEITTFKLFFAVLERGCAKKTRSVLQSFVVYITNVVWFKQDKILQKIVTFVQLFILKWRFLAWIIREHANNESCNRGKGHYKVGTYPRDALNLISKLPNDEAWNRSLRAQDVNFEWDESCTVFKNRHNQSKLWQLSSGNMISAK